jgi:uncharacterized delta-60 repeat protein
MHKSEYVGRRSQRALRASTRSLAGVALLVSAAATTSCGTAREDVSEGALAQSAHKVEWRPNYPGAPDPTFGGDGRVNMALRGGSNEAYAVAVQADGKVVAAGTTCGTELLSTCEAFLARYLKDGTLDTTFDVDGMVSASYGLEDTYFKSLLIQGDGKILVAGGTANSVDLRGEGHFALFARFNSDGTPDLTFGSNGVQRLPKGADEAATAAFTEMDQGST